MDCLYPCTYNCWTALHIASFEGQTQVMTELLETGVDIHAANKVSHATVASGMLVGGGKLNRSVSCPSCKPLPYVWL